MGRTSVYWFRNDLRLHDNEAFSAAVAESDYVLPVYCFDPLDYGRASSGIERTGPARANFILECVDKLRQSLRARGSDLIVRVGKPDEVLLTLAKCTGADVLYAHQEVSYEEIHMENQVIETLKAEGIGNEFLWGGTLIHVSDLPFSLDEIPTAYVGFRQMVQNVPVRKTIEAPKHLKSLPSAGGVKPGDIPTLEELGVEPFCAQSQDGEAGDGRPFIGGEEEALLRLKSLIIESPGHLHTDVGDVGLDDSIHCANFCNNMSPWLAIGCLSPRCMYEEMKNSERLDASLPIDGALKLLVAELLWRDFLRFVTKMYVSTKKGSDVTTVTACLEAAISPSCEIDQQFLVDSTLI
eukprot:c25449_g1_i1 orf=499-1554(+)